MNLTKLQSTIFAQANPKYCECNYDIADVLLRFYYRLETLYIS